MDTLKTNKKPTICDLYTRNDTIIFAFYQLIPETSPISYL